MKKNLNSFVHEVSNILNIKQPEISFSPCHFPTKTTLALIKPDCKTIYVRNDILTYDTYFAVAHELRHVWQFKNNKFPQLYFPPGKRSVEDYNQQLVEIDANAFAKIIMNHFFHVDPLFQGLSPEVINLINKQIPSVMKSLSL